MDEILIEEKRYISSKRAAKITGYAKDYIGQLCREGRVPARLVGRSWYVLETAIQDHRFGNQEITPRELESPKYEASPVEILPPVSRSDEEEKEAVTAPAEDSGDGVDNNISDSWREWFDRVSNTAPMSEIGAPTESVGEEIKKPEPEIEVEAEVETEPIEVPIHTIYRQPPQELLPRDAEEERIEEPEQPQIQQKVQKNSRAMIVAVQACGIALAMITVTLAVAGSGYLDRYIISVGQVRIIAGVTLYNK